MKFLKFKKKEKLYWDEPKWTPEMVQEIKNIFKDFEITKVDNENDNENDNDNDVVWDIKLNKDVTLTIVLNYDRDIPYLAFFSVETDIVWQNHAKSWTEFEHCDTWEYLLERLNVLPGRYSFKSLGKSFSKYWLEKLD